MIAISSIRPHNTSDAYRSNQIAARKSWGSVFEKIVYFSEVEPELDGLNVVWMPCSDYPFIWQMAEYAAKQKALSAIINADIVVTEELLKVEKIIESSFIQGATSRRYDLDTGLLNPEDKGRDIFILKSKGWKQVAELIPRSCRIGHNEWDSWMIGFMRKRFGKKFAEFTRCKCIFHPRHEERHRPFGDTVDISSPYKSYWDGTPDTQIVLAK